jgi:hypothetical protein
VPNVPAHEKYDDSASLKKHSGQALALSPYIVENHARGAVPIRNPMPRVQSYAQKEREYNCLRGQVNGHKATLSTTCLGTCPR